MIELIQELGHEISDALDRDDLAEAARLARRQRALIDELVTRTLAQASSHPVKRID